MRRAFAAIALLGLFAMAAYAAEVEDEVAEVDQETRAILLQNGTSYIAVESVDLSDIPVGTTVKITYDDASIRATKIEVGM